MDKYDLIHRLDDAWYQDSIGFSFDHEDDKYITVNFFTGCKCHAYVPFKWHQYYLEVERY